MNQRRFQPLIKLAFVMAISPAPFSCGAPEPRSKAHIDTIDGAEILGDPPNGVIVTAGDTTSTGGSSALLGMGGSSALLGTGGSSALLGTGGTGGSGGADSDIASAGGTGTGGVAIATGSSIGSAGMNAAGGSHHMTAIVAPAVTGTLVPLYTYPNHRSWSDIIAARLQNPTVPVIAVVNPANGPGQNVSADYVAGTAKLRAAGITVLGYVATGYTARADSVVKADIDKWRAFYPAVTGIFFDEMTNAAGFEDYYRRQTIYARSKGLTYTVGNPGADTAPSYVGVVDMILVYESAGLRPLSTWYDKYPRENFGIIPYAVPRLDSDYIQKAKKSVGFIYMTDDVLTNPWDSLPRYFPDLLSALGS